MGNPNLKKIFEKNRRNSSKIWIFVGPCVKKVPGSNPARAFAFCFFVFLVWRMFDYRWSIRVGVLQKNIFLFFIFWILQTWSVISVGSSLVCVFFIGVCCELKLDRLCRHRCGIRRKKWSLCWKVGRFESCSCMFFLFFLFSVFDAYTTRDVQLVLVYSKNLFFLFFLNFLYLKCQIGVLVTVSFKWK